MHEFLNYVYYGISAIGLICGVIGLILAKKVIKGQDDHINELIKNMLKLQKENDEYRKKCEAMENVLKIQETSEISVKRDARGILHDGGEKSKK